MMLRLLVCCLCLTAPTLGNILMEVSNELRLNQVGKPVCEPSADLRECEPAVNSRSHLARPGTVCRNNTGSWQCHSNGQWKPFSEVVKFPLDTENLQKIKRLHHVDAETMVNDLDIGQLQGTNHRQKRFWSLIPIICIFLCGRGSSPSLPPPPPPNKTPTILCPVLETQRPLVGTSMTVNWTEPVGNDKEEGELSPSRTGPGPGSVFDEGTHIITYYVTDSHGAAASCHIILKVEAYRCKNLPWPRDGIRTCTKQSVSGSECSVNCDDGFEVDGSRSVTCHNETWNDTLGTCQPISCGPEPDISNGKLICPEETVYETFCTLSCDEGFLPRGNLVSMCNKDGEYSTPGTCQDTTAPVFPDGCPLDLNYYAEKQNQPKLVTWSQPKVTDNSGNVTVTSNPANGSLFEPGVTTVTLTATDENGNSAGCKFKIIVNTLHCPEPDLGDERLIYNCSEGYGYGYSCSLMCEGNFPQAGSSTILCEIDEWTYPPNGTWTWPDDSFKPFCKSTECPELPAPENGAIACDGWTNGLICVMACNEEYDVPMNVADQYTCGEQTGSWYPNDKIYGCTVKRRPGKMELANEFYYYTGSCENETTQQTIAENFIHILNSNLAFLGICGETVPDCQAQFVGVRCGETSNRKRRHVNKRESHWLAIEFNVYYDLMSGDDFSEASSLAKAQLNSFTDAVDKLVDDGGLAMAEFGLTVQSNSFYAGYPKYSCENGEADEEKGSCRGCPKGTFSSESGDCIDCPVGQYNEDDFATSCTSCDEGFSTKSTGSNSPDYCIAKCPTGSYSSDGIEPCILCDSGSFADSIGSTTCTSCSETETSLQGATSSTDCVAYDLRIDPDSDSVVAEVTSNLTSVTLAFWFRANTSDGHTLLMLKNSEENPIVGVSVTNSLSVDVTGSSMDTEARPISNQWQHVALTLDGSTKEIAVFLMGQEVYRDTHVSLGTQVLPETSSMTSTAVTDSGILLSGITVASRVVTPTELQSMAKSCLSTFDDSVFKLLRSGKQLVAPSICDSDDGCKEDPCGSHPCQDTLGSFHCDCQDGWTGTICEIPPDFCANQKCQNDGICKNELTDFSCECPKGFKGDLCQIPIVDGNWSQWTSWAACSKTCGGGVRERSRACDSPSPDDDGDDCEGEAEELEECGVEECKECLPLRLSFGNEKTCWEEDNLQKCNVTCKSGMVFTDKSKLLDVYECGAVSDFVWNHQKAGGDRARPPACTESEGAVSYSAVTRVNYPELPCTDGEQQKEEIHPQISESINDLHCVKDITCSAEAKQDTCGQASTLRKRDITPTVISITLTTEMTLDITDALEAYGRDGTVSNVLESYIQQVLDADMTLQQMVNDSDNLFRLSLNGVVYNVDQDTITTESFINCRAGKVPRDGICVGCPPGTREQAGSCVLCATGSYQNLPASTECKPCPKGKTTLHTGALDVSECSVYVFIPDKKRESNLHIVLPIVIIVVLMVTIAVSCCVGQKLRKRKSRRFSVQSVQQIKVKPMITNESWAIVSPPPMYTEKMGPP